MTHKINIDELKENIKKLPHTQIRNKAKSLALFAFVAASLNMGISSEANAGINNLEITIIENPTKEDKQKLKDIYNGTETLKKEVSKSKTNTNLDNIDPSLLAEFEERYKAEQEERKAFEEYLKNRTASKPSGNDKFDEAEKDLNKTFKRNNKFK